MIRPTVLNKFVPKSDTFGLRTEGISLRLDAVSICILELLTNCCFTLVSWSGTHLETKLSNIEQFSCWTHRYLAYLLVRTTSSSWRLQIWNAFRVRQTRLHSRQRSKCWTPMTHMRRKSSISPEPQWHSSVLCQKLNSTRKLWEPKQLHRLGANRTPKTIRPTKSTKFEMDIRQLEQTEIAAFDVQMHSEIQSIIVNEMINYLANDQFLILR